MEWEPTRSRAAHRSWEEWKGKNQLSTDLLPTNGIMVEMNKTDWAVNRNAQIVIPTIQLLFNIIFFSICMTGSRSSKSQ